MQYLKTVMVIFYLFIFVFISVPGYCFFRDDMDHERIIREVEEKRKESKERLREEQKKEELEQKEKIKVQEPVPKGSKEVEKTPARPKSKIGIMVFLILCLGVGGYLFYRRKG